MTSATPFGTAEYLYQQRIPRCQQQTMGLGQLAPFGASRIDILISPQGITPIPPCSSHLQLPPNKRNTLAITIKSKMDPMLEREVKRSPVSSDTSSLTNSLEALSGSAVSPTAELPWLPGFHRRSSTLSEEDIKDTQDVDYGHPAPMPQVAQTSSGTTAWNAADTAMGRAATTLSGYFYTPTGHQVTVGDLNIQELSDSKLTQLSFTVRQKKLPVQVSANKASKMSPASRLSGRPASSRRASKISSQGSKPQHRPAPPVSVVSVDWDPTKQAELRKWEDSVGDRFLTGLLDGAQLKQLQEERTLTWRSSSGIDARVLPEGDAIASLSRSVSLLQIPGVSLAEPSCCVAFTLFAEHNIANKSQNQLRASPNAGTGTGTMTPEAASASPSSRPLIPRQNLSFAKQPFYFNPESDGAETPSVHQYRYTVSVTEGTGLDTASGADPTTDEAEGACWTVKLIAERLEDYSLHATPQPYTDTRGGFFGDGTPT